jgi:hypothetical protein
MRTSKSLRARVTVQAGSSWLSLRRCGVFPRVCQERCVLDEVVLGEVFLLERQLRPVTIIPQDPHAHISFIFYGHSKILYTESIVHNKLRKISNASTHILSRQLIAWTILKVGNPRKRRKYFKIHSSLTFLQSDAIAFELLSATHSRSYGRSKASSIVIPPDSAT